MKWISKERVKHLLYISLPMLCITILSILLYSLDSNLVPDYFNIRAYSKKYELLNLIVSSLLSLIAIYITVSLVAYEFFKQRSGIDFHKSLLVNKVNTFFISLTVSTIIFAFTCSFILNIDQPSYKDVTLIYFNIFLFLFILFLLFPVAFNLFSSLKPEKVANEEIQKLNQDTVLFKKVSYNIDDQVEILERDPLIKIENLVIALVSVSDIIKAQAIIQKTSYRLAELIIAEDNPAHKKNITKRLVSFYINIIDFALLQPNNSFLLRAIWLSVSGMYRKLADKKESSIHYSYFRHMFMARYLTRLIENGKEEILGDGLGTINHIIVYQFIHNMPPDDKIPVFDMYRREFDPLFEEHSHDDADRWATDDHWKELAFEAVQVFPHVLKKAIALNKSDIFKKTIQEMDNMTYSVYRSRVGLYKETFLYINVVSIVTDYTYNAFKRGILDEGADIFGLMPRNFALMIEGNHPAMRTVLQKYCGFLINMQRIGRLDRWFLGGLAIGDLVLTEGDLAEAARNCVKSYEKGKYIQGALEDCVETLAIMKEYWEKKKTDDYGLYSLLKTRLESILKSIEKDKTEAPQLIERIELLIKSFKSQTEYEQS